MDAIAVAQAAVRRAQAAERDTGPPESAEADDTMPAASAVPVPPPVRPAVGDFADTIYHAAEAYAPGLFLFPDPVPLAHLVISPVQRATFASMMMELGAGRTVTTAFVGPAGTGKTSMVHWLAAEHRLPLYIESMSMSLEALDLWGERAFVDNQTAWTVSGFARAMAFPGPAIINLTELNRVINETVLNGLFAALDRVGRVWVRSLQRWCAVVPPKLVIADLNVGAEYTGTVGSGDHALRDRFQTVVEFDYLTPEQETELLLRYKIGKNLAAALADLAQRIRVRCAQQGWPGLSFRRLEACATHLANLFRLQRLAPAIMRDIGQMSLLLLAVDQTITYTYSAVGGTDSPRTAVAGIVHEVVAQWEPRLQSVRG